MADLVPNARLERQFRRIDLQLDVDDPEYVRRRYRFTPDGLDRLVRLIGDRLERPTRRNRPLTPRQQIMITLRFYASGSFLQVLGDTFGVDVATVSRVVTDVTNALFDLKDMAISFPVSRAEKQVQKRGFHEIRGFPSVIGLIDGTHVHIISPSKEQEAHYVNRHHRHSLNVQATCDAQGRFTSLNAAWPGSSHDSHVFRVSNLARHLEDTHMGLDDGLLLGDSGYACRPFLLTPFLHPANEMEENFNRAHIATRNLIERTFGVWKRKFHVLADTIRMKPRKVSRIVVACAVLHNLSINWNMGEDFDDADNILPQPPVNQFRGEQDGRGVRAHIAQTFFR